MPDRTPYTCKLCMILENPFRDGELRTCDTPFHSSESFVAIPALSPLCLGHAMIISKKHCTSLLSMDRKVQTEFETQCATLSVAWANEQILFAEHGASCSDEAGPCIAHTHVNVFPGLSQTALDLSQLGHTVIASGQLQDLPLMSDGYFLIGSPGSWWLYESDTAPSQYLRRLLYARFGLPHWDWHLFQDEPLTIATLQQWQHRLSV